MRAKRGLLGVLERLDSGLAALEATLIALFLFELAAGGLALVIQQNAGREMPAALLAALTWTALGLAALALVLFVVGRRELGLKLLLPAVLVALVRASLYIEGGVDYVVRASVLWIGLLGASLATRQRKHITVEALEKFLPREVKRLATLVVSLTSAGLLAVLFRVSLGYVRESRERGEVFFTLRKEGVELDVPEWWAKVILPVGLSLMMWRFGLIFLEALARHEPEPEQVPETGETSA